MKTFFIALAVFFIVATVLPLVRSEAWWVRIFDFPRAQIAIAGILITAVYIYFWDTKKIIEDVVLGALLLCVGYQAVKMFPYTVFARYQVLPSEEATHTTKGGDARTARLSILIANVLMENRQSDLFLRLVEEYDPDIVLTVETDQWWADQLSVLDSAYPHSVKKPLDNTYGMILQSRLQLIDPQVRYVVEDSVPSIYARVPLETGVEVAIYSLHPRPPHPKEDTSTADRDAELLIIGREVKESGGPSIVMGDMNDVAWSHTTALFQNVSGLLDPRIGRGLFNSFNAKNPVLRWPLDHIFHSEHFKLVDLERLPAFGSDHFPIFVHLEYSPAAASEQEKPETDPDEEQEATEKIEKANDAR